MPERTRLNRVADMAAKEPARLFVGPHEYLAGISIGCYDGGMPQSIALDEGMAETLRQALELDQFYAILTADKVNRLFPNSGLFLFAKDETILSQGEESKDIYIIQTGEISVSQGFGPAAVEIGRLGAGNMFGEIALVKEQLRSANCVALEESRVYMLSVADVKRIMLMDDKLKNHLIELANRRLAK